MANFISRSLLKTPVIIHLADAFQTLSLKVTNALCTLDEKIQGSKVLSTILGPQANPEDVVPVQVLNKPLIARIMVQTVASEELRRKRSDQLWERLRNPDPNDIVLPRQKPASGQTLVDNSKKTKLRYTGKTSKINEADILNIPTKGRTQDN